MRKLITPVLAIVLGLSGCTTHGGMSSGNEPGGYCNEHTAVCVAGGVLIAGLAAGIIANSHDHSGQPQLSDIRLKHDIKPLTMTENGIRIYTFRYNGDNRLFSGVLAQDLLKDARFRSAVTRDDAGFYAVDYAKLGLPMVNADAMLTAGRNAERAIH